jgi:glycerol kinase
MSINTEKGHLVRAMLEAPCFRTKEVIDAMVKDSGSKITKVNVDGGMTVNNFVMQT